MRADDERCINHKCASNRHCKYFVKPSLHGERIFYGYAPLGFCEEFEELRKPYGVGAEEGND